MPRRPQFFFLFYFIQPVLKKTKNLQRFLDYFANNDENKSKDGRKYRIIL